MTPDYTKILVMTDLHLRSRGKTIIGLDPIARFKSAYDAALADHPDAAAMVLMGDLTHSGHLEEYQILRDILTTCPVPVLPMLGNHDIRATFLQVFTNVPLTAAGHVQQIMDLPHHRIITLETHDTAPAIKHEGLLSQERLAWLDAALAGAAGKMPIVFAHHPAFPVGLPGMDAIALTNGHDLLDRLQGKGAHLFCGHVHRTISGQAKGVPFTIFKSPCHQAPLDLTTADSTLSTAEAGAYGLILLTSDGVIVHSEDVGTGATPVAGADALPDVPLAISNRAAP